MATKKTASRTPAKKTASNATKKNAPSSTTRKAAKSSSTDPASGQTDRSADAPRTAKRPTNRTRKPASPESAKLSGTAVAARAAQQLLELAGRAVEGVTGLEKTDDGWRVQVEVVEVRRIPDTTDVLALYEIDVDSDGDLVGYRRLRRYVRGKPGEE